MEIYVVMSTEYWGDEISSEFCEYHKTFAGAVRKALSEKKRYSKQGYTMVRENMSWYNIDYDNVEVTICIVKIPLKD